MAEFACVGLCARSADRVDCRGWANYLPRRRKRSWDRDLQKSIVIDLGPAVRSPPLPFWAGAVKVDTGVYCCRVCGQPVYAGGDWRLAAGRPSREIHWHKPCVVAYTTWTKVNVRWRYLAERQNWRCRESGEDFRANGGYLLDGPEVDHERPLWRISAEPHRYAWPSVLYWYGLANLRALTPTAHKAKTAREAAERAAMRRAAIAPTGVA